jgi:hypothetical protein
MLLGEAPQSSPNNADLLLSTTYTRMSVHWSGIARFKDICRAKRFIISSYETIKLGKQSLKLNQCIEPTSNEHGLGSCPFLEILVSIQEVGDLLGLV